MSKAGRSLFVLIAIICIGLFMVLPTVQADLNTGLVAYYPFSGNANDASGSGNNGVVHGATFIADRAGAPDNAMGYNGAGDYFECANFIGGNTDAITVSAWIFKSSFDPVWDETIVATEAFRFQTVGDGRLYVCWTDGTLNNTHLNNLYSTSGDLNTGMWQHIVFVKNGLQISFYKNGNLLISTNNFNYARTIQSLRIGSDGLTGVGQIDYFKGIIDEVCVYNRALTASEIFQLYTNNSTPIVPLSPVVSNVRATQRAQTNLVDVFYDLSAPNNGPFSVAVAVSTNNGITYNLPASSFTGNGIGSAVTLGKGKRVVWDAGHDWPGQYSSTVRFKVAASESGVAGDYLVVDLSAGPEASSYPVSYLTAVPAGGWTDEYKTTKMVFRRIPAGTFTRGSPV